MAEELNDAQIQELRTDLRSLKAKLREALSVSEQAARPVVLDQAATGRLTRMDAMQQQKMAQATHQAQKLRSSQVTAALQAVTDGDYGECRRCEEPVGYRRLKAKPETPFCIECQGAIQGRR